MDESRNSLRTPLSRALVTGGAGFIGSHLVEALAASGCHVVVVDDLSTGSAKHLVGAGRAVTLVSADVRDSPEMARIVHASAPQCVFHLAANAAIPASARDPVWDFGLNAGGTVSLLEAVRRLPPKRRPRFVLASTGAVYGEPTRLPIDEDSPTAPISPYGASKLSAEACVGAFVRSFGVDGVIVRMFNAYGPRMGAFVVRDIIEKLLHDPSRLELLGSGEQVRDFTYVTDAAQGLLVAAARGEPGAVYNVASGVSCSIRELAAEIANAMPIRPAPEIVCSGASWAGDAQRWEVSVERIAALGYRPRVARRDGLRRTAEWFRQNQ